MGSWGRPPTQKRMKFHAIGLKENLLNLEVKSGPNVYGPKATTLPCKPPWTLWQGEKQI
jgi:hypothetical protein